MSSKIIKAVKNRIEAEATIILTAEENPKQKQFVFVQDGKVLQNVSFENAPTGADLYEHDGYSYDRDEIAFIFRKIEKNEVRKTFTMIAEYENGTRKGLMNQWDINAYNLLQVMSSLMKCDFNTIRNWAFETLGTESINLIGKGNLVAKLREHAKILRKALNAQHVVFGVNRDKLGHFRTFFIPMTDRELNVHETMTVNYINAVHA